MNFASWILALSLLIALFIQGTRYHHSLVCRQEAWLLALEIRTEALLTEKKALPQMFILKCKTAFSREGHRITWRQFPTFKSHHLSLELMGKL